MWSKPITAEKSERGFPENERAALRLRMEKPVFVRADAAADGLYWKSRLCGRVRGGRNPYHEWKHFFQCDCCLYIRMFTQPLSQLAQAAASLQSAAAASERVFEFLCETELSDESGKKIALASADGNVEFSHVRFVYDAEKLLFTTSPLP